MYCACVGMVEVVGEVEKTVGWVTERWWSRGSDGCGSGVRFQKQRRELCEVGPEQDTTRICLGHPIHQRAANY